MARLFLSQKEVDFFSDITKEFIKDVAGQKIYYYKVREDLTKTNTIYEEAIEKIFNPPLELECLIEWNPSEVKTNQFGLETVKTVNAYIHSRDILDRNIILKEGDYFSYGSYFFEITSLIIDKIAAGQVERTISYKIVGKQTRIQHINKQPIGPTSEHFTDEGSIQVLFEQQRGRTETDKRQLLEDGVIDKTINTKNKISADGSVKSINKIGTSFYGDE